MKKLFFFAVMIIILGSCKLCSGMTSSTEKEEIVIVSDAHNLTETDQMSAPVTTPDLPPHRESLGIPILTTLERGIYNDIVRLQMNYGTFTISVQYFEEGLRTSMMFGLTEDGTNIFGYDEYVDTDVPLLAYILYFKNETGYTHRLYIVSIFDDSLTLFFDRDFDGIFNTENVEFLDENTVLWEYRAELDGELVSEIFTIQ